MSAPFQLRACTQRIEEGFSRIYGYYLLNAMKASYHRKLQRMKIPLTVNLRKIKTLFAFDDHITAPLNGFANAEEYYTRNSCVQFLQHIQTPTLIINALDDPLMYPYTVPTKEQLSDQVILELADHGGHIGFVCGNVPWRMHYWLDGRISQWLQERL